MCLILLAYRCIPGYEVVLASNRDEFYERPTERADWWDSPEGIAGGRDLKAGGTWLGVSRNRRLASVTNIRERHGSVDRARSRGLLVVDYLTSTESAADFCGRVSIEPGYDGYNLVLWDGVRMTVCSNRAPGMLQIEPGLFGISNGPPESAWPKVRAGVQRFSDLLKESPPRNPDLLKILRNREPAPDSHLPDTGFGIEWERLLSSAFIASETYGTRCSTIVRIAESGHVTLDEYSYNLESAIIDHRHLSFSASQHLEDSSRL